MALLTGGETQRVWSVLVTVFGDLAQAPTDRIGGAALSRISGAVGFRPEATRVALHRLKKDGWLDSERLGRTSRYYLTELGRRESAAASPRIYAAAPAEAPGWTLFLAPVGETGALDSLAVRAAPHVLRINTQTLLAAGPVAPVPSGLLSLDGRLAALPGWVRDKVCDADRIAASHRLSAALRALDAALPDTEPLSPIEVAVLRVLIVHGWRRLILPLPDLPDALFPDGWQGADCRALVQSLLAALPRPPLADLEAEADPLRPAG